MLEVKIHIVAPELVAALGALVGGAAAASNAKPAAAPKESKPAAAEKAGKPETAATSSATSAPPSGESADEKRAKATKLLQQINTANGIDAVRAALGEFGVANISATSDDKLDEVIAAFSDKIA